METLHLYGYISHDYNSLPALKKDNETSSYRAESIPESIGRFAETNGIRFDHEEGLGGQISLIPNCNLKIYYTSHACSLEQAMMSLDSTLYGGDFSSKTEYEGYSEYTITGIDLTNFAIGGHDLTSELDAHMGQYCHIILECEPMDKRNGYAWLNQIQFPL